MTSLSTVQLAVERIADLDEMMADLVRERAALKAEVDAFIIKRDKPVELPNMKLTVVRGFTSFWDLDKLRDILPKPVLFSVTKQVVDSEKLDAAVRDKKIDLDEITPAFMQVAKAPYVKWTAVTDKSKRQAAQDAQAEALAARL